MNARNWWPWYTLLLVAWTSGMPTRATAAEIVAEDCRLVLVGPIIAGDEALFQRAVLDRLDRKCDVIRLYLYSPGGDIGAALEIGRQVQMLQMVTVGPTLSGQLPDRPPVPRNAQRVCEMLPGEKERYDREYEKDKAFDAERIRALQSGKRMPESPAQLWTYDPLSGVGDERCVCGSACFFIWAAGAERKGDAIEIHRPYFERSEYAALNLEEARKAYQALVKEARVFLAEVEIPESIVVRMFNIPSTEAGYLTADELSQLRSAAYMDELKTAKCGPEPVRGADSEEDKNRPYIPPSNEFPYPNLTRSARQYFTELLLREKCWRDEQPEMRASLMTEYRAKYRRAR